MSGGTLLEKRRYVRENLDHLRRALMWEPRGHKDMYGAILMEKNIDEADLSVLFIHNEGTLSTQRLFKDQYLLLNDFAGKLPTDPSISVTLV